MNLFGFVLADAITGLLTFLFYGLFFGLTVLGIIRIFLLSVVERKEG